MKIGDSVFVHGYVDEIRKDCVIIRNKGGYFGTAPSEVIETINELPSAEAVHKPDYSYEADMVRRLKESLSAKAVQGEWIDEDGNNVPLHKDGYTLKSCYCNQCHEWLVGSDEYSTKGNFCHNCGADMRGEDK